MACPRKGPSIGPRGRSRFLFSCRFGRLHPRGRSSMTSADAVAAAVVADESARDAENAAWRDRIKIHPAADLFPVMSDPELDALAADIAQNGLLPSAQLTFWTPMQMGDKGWGRILDTDFRVLDWANRHKWRRGYDLFLLDGRNRLAAIERIADF